MTTGKIEYSPDYKSPHRDSRGLPVDEHGWPVFDVVSLTGTPAEANRAAAERARLEREVVEKAKVWKQKRDDGDNEKWSVNYVQMCEAIDALLAFEAEQK